MVLKGAKKYDFYQCQRLFVCDLYLYRMIAKAPKSNLLFAAFLLLFLAFSQLAISQPVLGLDKKGKQKRLHFYEGDRLRVKLVTNEKVHGRIDAIYDSSFVIHGRKILLSEVRTVYSSRPAFRYIGALFVIGGLFYTGIDIVNNAVTPENNYVFSQNTLVYAGTSVGIGLVLSYFGTRRTNVYQKNTFRIFNPTPISLDSNAYASDSTQYCENGVEAVLSKLNLDGCNWVLMLPDGEKLEPMNIYDFLTEAQMEAGNPLKIRVEFYDTKSASICMVGRTVAISCWEVLKE